MDEETSPFIEVSGGRVGSSISLANCIDMSLICKILIIIVVMYILYMSFNGILEKNNTSFVEKQIELLNARQNKNLC